MEPSRRRAALARVYCPLLALAITGVLICTDLRTIDVAWALARRPGLLADAVFFASKLLTLAFLIYGVLLVILSVYVWGGPERRRASMVLLGGSVAQVFTTELLKTLFGRGRPHAGEEAGIFHGPSLASLTDSSLKAFPSGHAAWSFMAAAILSAYYPQYRALFYTLAVATSASRFFVCSHYAGDIFAGACIGATIGALFLSRYPPIQATGRVRKEEAQ